MTICPACRTLVRRASSLSSAVILRPLMSAAAAVAACRQVFALRGASSHSTVSTHQPYVQVQEDGHYAQRMLHMSCTDLAHTVAGGSNQQSLPAMTLLLRRSSSKQPCNMAVDASKLASRPDAKHV